MALRRYLRWLSYTWPAVTAALVGAGMLTGCIIVAVASTKEMTKFTALCAQQHGKVYDRKGTSSVVCVRGVELEFPEFEEEEQ